MPFSPTLELVLTLATREAARSEFAAIEPDHLLLGLLKFADLDLDYDVLGNAGFDPTVREQIDAERREIGQWLQQRGLEATALRRQLRRALGTGNQPLPAHGLQRSPATETRFQQAQGLAGGEGQDLATATHLLRVLFKQPTRLLAQQLAEQAAVRAAPRWGQDVAEVTVRREDLTALARTGQLQQPAPARLPQGRALARLVRHGQAKPIVLIADQEDVVHACVKAMTLELLASAPASTTSDSTLWQVTRLLLGQREQPLPSSLVGIFQSLLQTIPPQRNQVLVMVGQDWKPAAADAIRTLDVLKDAVARRGREARLLFFLPTAVADELQHQGSPALMGVYPVWLLAQLPDQVPDELPPLGLRGPFAPAQPFFTHQFAEGMNQSPAVTALDLPLFSPGLQLARAIPEVGSTLARLLGLPRRVLEDSLEGADAAAETILPPVGFEPQTRRVLFEEALALATEEPDNEQPGLVDDRHLAGALALSAEVCQQVPVIPPARAAVLAGLHELWIQELAAPRLDDLTETVTRLRDRLRAQVFGQDHAIQAFVEGLFNAEIVAGADQERHRPEAVFVFAGPPGVGKTFLAEESARALGRPFRRFDMSAYSGPQAGESLIGVHRSFHGAHAGLLTGFVAAHPNAVLLFDEIEKAHLHTLHLFLQVLDVGGLEDQFTERTVEFRETLLIFTTNAGRVLYDRPEATALRHAPPEFHRRTLLSALASELDPRTGAPVFPPALCSRLATGYPVLFNPLGVNELERVAAAALQRQAERLETQYGKIVDFGPVVPLCLVLREGVATEARTVRAQAENFLKSELLKFGQLYRRERLDQVWRQTVRLQVDLDPASLVDPEVSALLEPCAPPRVLLVADERLAALWLAELPGVAWRTASDRTEVLAALAGGEVDWVLLNLWLTSARQGTVLQFDHTPATARALAQGLEILRALHERYPQVPCYLLSFTGDAPDYYRVDEELLLTCARQGARGVVETAFVSQASPQWQDYRAALAGELVSTARYLYRERQARALGAAHQVLTFDTTPQVVAEERTVRIRLRNLRLTQAVAAADVAAVLTAVERPEFGFDQVFGADVAKAELGFIVRWLQDPRRYQGLGLRPPRGILLHGPPGTGKTLLARALAGESRVAFLEAAAANFVTVWQGSGPQNVRELFARARRYAPAIVFIDEIDAIGKQRIGSTRPTEETLNALLTEMDGFRTPVQPPVVVIAATNQVELLDEALRRRFDREVEVDKPDRRAREQYLQQRLRGMAAGLLSDAAIESLAGRSAGMTIAGLERVVALAGRLAIEWDGALDDALLDEAFMRLQLGEVRELSDPALLLRVARHEAGHGLIGWLAGRKPIQISILARGRVGGSVESESDEERMVYTRVELESLIRQALGGRAAELLYYGERDGPSTSAASDLRAATRYAEQMVRDYGMDEGIGPLALAPGHWEHGPLAMQVLQAVQRIVKDQLALALEELRVHRPALDRLVEALQVRNRLTHEELENLLSGLS